MPVGQFGTPYVNIAWIDELLATTPYDDFVQHSFAPAQYWKVNNIIKHGRTINIYELSYAGSLWSRQIHWEGDVFTRY